VRRVLPYALPALTAVVLGYLLVVVVLVAGQTARNQEALAQQAQTNRTLLRQLRANESAICRTDGQVHFEIGVGLLCPSPPPVPSPTPTGGHP